MLLTVTIISLTILLMCTYMISQALFRNYADWIWSAYNFWCSPTYDLHCGSSGAWVDPAEHHRSPDALHDIVNGAINGTSVPSPLALHPCEHGHRFTRHFVEELWAAVPVEKTLFLASELLSDDPAEVWRHISRRTCLNKIHPAMSKFMSVRYNTQVAARSKGTKNAISKEKFTQGYFVSGFQPMLNVTRSILDACWAEDCQFASAITGYQFGPCRESSLSLAMLLKRYVSVDSSKGGS